MCTSCFIDYCLRELFSQSCNTEIFRETPPLPPQHSLLDLDPADPPVLDIASSFPAWCVKEESDCRTRLQSILPCLAYCGIWLCSILPSPFGVQ